MGCPDEYDFCVIRGDNFVLDVGLTTSWPEVIENPSGYTGKLVLRDDQDDALTPRLEMTATPELAVTTPQTAPMGAAVYLHFAATPAQTQLLPDWNLVGYAELRNTSGSDVRRLFNSRVTVED